jgi:predicted small lipoprotein YifL
VNGRLYRLTAGVMLALCLAGPLAACGKKGAPAAPKDEPNVYPRAYPNDPTQPSKAPDPSAFPSTNDHPRAYPNDPTRPVMTPDSSAFPSSNTDPTRSPE